MRIFGDLCSPNVATELANFGYGHIRMEIFLRLIERQSSNGVCTLDVVAILSGILSVFLVPIVVRIVPQHLIMKRVVRAFVSSLRSIMLASTSFFIS